MAEQTGSGRRGILLAIVFSLVVVAGAAYLALRPREPRTEVEAVMRVHVRFVDAAVAGDFEAIWDLLAAETREDVARGLRAWRDPDTARRMGTTVEAHLGMTRDELEGMDARTFLVEGLRRHAERDIVDRREEVRRLRELDIRRVTMTDAGADVVCDGEPWKNVAHGPNRYRPRATLTFRYRKEDDGWRFERLVGAPITSFLPPLERKLPCPLPRGNVGPEIDAVVTIGPEGIAPEGARLVTRRLEAILPEPRDGSVVVLDVTPGISFQGAVRAVEAIRAAGVERVLVAETSPDGPASGLRVNGTRVGSGEDAAAGSVPAGTLERVIRLPGDRR